MCPKYHLSGVKNEAFCKLKTLGKRISLRQYVTFLLLAPPSLFTGLGVQFKLLAWGTTNSSYVNIINKWLNLKDTGVPLLKTILYHGTHHASSTAIWEKNKTDFCNFRYERVDSPWIAWGIWFSESYSSAGKASSTCCTINLSILSHHRVKCPSRTCLRCVCPNRTIVTLRTCLARFLSCEIKEYTTACKSTFRTFQSCVNLPVWLSTILSNNLSRSYQFVHQISILDSTDWLVSNTNYPLFLKQASFFIAEI